MKAEGRAYQIAVIHMVEKPVLSRLFERPIVPILLPLSQVKHRWVILLECEISLSKGGAAEMRDQGFRYLHVTERLVQRLHLFRFVLPLLSLLFWAFWVN